MIFKDIVAIFNKKGFNYAKGNVPNIYIFLRSSPENELNICLFINNTEERSIGINILNNLSDALERKFLFNGFRKVTVFYIVLSDNLDRDRNFLSQSRNFWIIDKLGRRLIIFEEQPDDYFGLKQDFETLLVPAQVITSGIKSAPIATISLIIINLVIFLITAFSSGSDNSRYLLEHGGSYWKFIYENHEYYRLFTCMFLHFNSEHLMNNMVTLAFIGAATEKFLGHIRFLSIYLCSGLGASILSSLYYMHNSPDTITVSAGASGAIFGVLGALIIISLMYKKQRQRLNPLNILLIAVLSISNGYMNSSIDNIAHISGLLFGIILTFISCLYRKNVIK